MSIAVEQEVRPAVSAGRTSTALRALARAVSWLMLLATLAVAGLVGVLPHVSSYRTLTVLSASMVPTFRPGDVVVVRPEPIADLRVGQVITYQVPVGARQVETHRVVKILRGQGSQSPVIQTQGDANSALDPWTAQLGGPTVWRLQRVVPKLGYLLNAMRNPLAHRISVLVLPAMLALTALAKLWGVGVRKSGAAA